MKATCKNSANLEQETKTTKIVTYPLLSLASSNMDQLYYFSNGIVKVSSLNWIELRSKEFVTFPLVVNHSEPHI